MSFNILIVEDDKILREALVDTIELQKEIKVFSANSAEEAIISLNNHEIDLVISDIQMPQTSGLDLLQRLHQNAPEIPVILMTAHGTVQDAVFAIQHGAADYITKPFEPEELMHKIERYMPTYNHSDFNPIAEDESSKKVLCLAKKISNTDATVLISGESGTGKEVLARYIHVNSNRADKPFVAINCAAIPENMLEATLFGYEKGSFTGAVKSTEGKFEQAQGGTILLDEISEMDLALQAKLLRVLQEKEVERIGGRKLIKLDVRILSTTNRNLKEYVKENKFREDLFYRLNIVPISWLPLRERKKDIIPLANYFLEKLSKKQGVSMPSLTAPCVEKLLEYYWPGNIREMENIIQRAFIFKSGNEINENDLYMDLVDTNITTIDNKKIKNKTKSDNKLNDTLKKQEEQQIISALKTFKGSRIQVAEALGISQRTLRYKIARMKKEGIEVE